jgi:hypothetical protein
VRVVQVIDQPNPWGEIGKGLGQGLSEQLPKEVDRNRLVQGLKNLPKGGSLIDNAAYLYSIPGMRPELAQTLLPLLANQSQIEALNSQAGSDMSQSQQGGMTTSPKMGDVRAPGMEKTDQPIPQPRSEFEKSFGYEPKSLRTPADIERAKSQRPVWSQQQKYQRAAQLDPRLYPTIQDRLAQVDREEKYQQDLFDTGISAANSRMMLQTAAEQDFNKKLTSLLQKGSESETWASIPAEFQQKYTNKVRSLVDEGESPEVASEKVSNEALSFVKSREKLISAKTSFFDVNKVPYQQQIKGSRRAYEKAGALDLYKNDLENAQGLGPYLSSEMAFPPSSDINKEIGKLPKVRVKVSKDGIPIGTKDFPLAIPNVESIAKNITPDDSLKTIQSELRNKGYDDLELLDTVKRLYSDGQVSLTDRQVRELEDYRPSSYNLSDFWFTLVKSLTGRS